MEPKPFSLTYHEHLSDSIDQLESLQDRESFDYLLQATAIERTALFESAAHTYFHIFREDIPQDIVDKIYLPDRLWLHTIHAQLTELPELDRGDGPKDWTLTVRFANSRDPLVDPVGTSFTMITTPLETVCTTTNIAGDPLTIRSDAITGQKFLLAMLGSAIQDETATETAQQTYQQFKAITETAELSPELITGSLIGLGQRLGTFQKMTTSYLAHPERDDAALAVRVTEDDAEGTNERRIDFYLNSQILSGSEAAEAKHTAMLALRFEDIRHDGIVLSALEKQYSKRLPTTVPIDELSFAVRMGMFEHVDGVQFDPATNREQYGLIASSIMRVVNLHLQAYSKYDTPASYMLTDDDQ